MPRRHSPSFVIYAVVTVMMSGCASDKVVGPAKTVGTSVSQFQASLTKLQSTVNAYRDAQQIIVDGNVAKRDQAVNDVQVLETKWELLEADGATKMFAALQAQSGKQLTALLNPPAAQPKLVRAVMPADKLGGVAATISKIATAPDEEADIENLVKYGTAVYSQLHKNPDQTGAAAAPQ